MELGTLLWLLVAAQPANEHWVGRPMVDVIDRLDASDSPLRFERTKCMSDTCLGTVTDGDGDQATVSMQEVAGERTVVRAYGTGAAVQELWQLLESLPAVVPASVPPRPAGRIFAGPDPRLPFRPRDPFAWFYVDVYSGLIGPQDTRTQSFQFSPSPSSTAVDSRLDPGLALGVRPGFWLGEAPYIGGAIDVTYIHQSGDGISFDFVPISFLGVVRVQFGRSPEFPQGRVAPRLAMGVALMLGSISSDQMLASNHVFGPGFDIRFGVPVQLSPTVAVFGEWRWLKANPDSHQDGAVVSSVDTTFEASQFVVGASFNLR